MQLLKTFLLFHLLEYALKQTQKWVESLPPGSRLDVDALLNELRSNF